MSSDAGHGIFQVGDVLNNTYRIDKVLGLGGTSEVYRAVSEISGRVVAVKALRTEFSRNEDFLALMTREEEMREIRHDAVVRYYDNQRTDDGHVYLVMDYVDGPGLDQKIKEGGLSADDVLIVCRRVAEGLVAAHKKNIVHRDLSPDNIILRDGDPADAVIIDFGIAKDTNPGAETIVGNEFAGKFGYAAPEQLNGQTDARADVYALGALMLATFRGQKPNMGSNLMEIVKIKALPLDTSGVPEPLKSLIERMTHPDRDQRLQTAQAVLDEVTAPGTVSGSGTAQGADDDDDDRTIVVPRTPRQQAPVARTPAQTVPPPAKKDEAATQPVETRKKRGVLMPVLAVLVLGALALGAYLTGALNTVLGPNYPFVDPYTLVVTRPETGPPSAIGNVPSETARDALRDLMIAQGGTSDLTLARGNLTETWDSDILRLIGAVSHLPEWQVRADETGARITAMTLDATEQGTLSAALERPDLRGAFDVVVDVFLGPRILAPQSLAPILAAHQNCGELRIATPPPAGYPNGSQVVVRGRVDSAGTRQSLSGELSAVIGDRTLVLNVEVLNRTLCLIDRVLPNAPPAGFDIEFRDGDDNAINLSGDYFVGDNPVIDVIVPAEITDGYLFVSALDVSGNVYHLLPNILFPDNSVAALRGGQDGAVSVRVAHSTADAVDGGKLAFVVDDTTLGKTKIIAIHSDQQIFDGLRPTTESAAGYADAMAQRVGSIRSLDSRILTTAQ